MKPGILAILETADMTEASIRDLFDMLVRFCVLPNRLLVGVTVPNTFKNHLDEINY